MFDAWRRAVGLAGLALTGGVPVQQAFYEAFMRQSGNKVLKDIVLESGMMRLARGMHFERSQVTAGTRYSYWLAFDVSPDEQEALERMLDQVTPQWSAPVTNGFPFIRESWN